MRTPFTATINPHPRATTSTITSVALIELTHSRFDKTGGAATSPVTDLPWFMHVYPGTGIYPNNTDCLPNCPRLPDMEQIIAAFLLARGDYAWLGYE
jgi:hypothetical protein